MLYRVVKGLFVLWGFFGVVVLVQWIRLLLLHGRGVGASEFLAGYSIGVVLFGGFYLTIGGILALLLVTLGRDKDRPDR